MNHHEEVTALETRVNETVNKVENIFRNDLTALSRLKIEAIKPHLEMCDQLVDISKNALTVSMTAWVAVLAIPQAVNTELVSKICIGIMASSLIIVVGVGIARFILTRRIKGVYEELQGHFTHVIKVQIKDVEADVRFYQGEISSLKERANKQSPNQA